MCIPSIKLLFRELFVYVHCTKYSFSEKVRSQCRQVNKFLFNTSENIYIFRYFASKFAPRHMALKKANIKLKPTASASAWQLMLQPIT